MITSHKHRFHYIHIPRTGGSSFTWNYRKCFDDYNDNIKPIKGFQGHFHKKGMHSTYLKNRKEIDESGYFSFAFVRNPWDWVFSWFTVLTDVGPVNKNRFEMFVKNPYESHRHLVNMQQLDYVCDEKGNIKLDYIARYEGYDAEMEMLERRLGLVQSDDRRLNHSKHDRDYHDFYTDEAREIVRRRYNNDIEAFGYEY